MRWIVRSHFGCCCQHEKTWRLTQTKNTQFSHASCKVQWGPRWDFRTFIVNCKQNCNFCATKFSFKQIKIKITLRIINFSFFITIHRALLFVGSKNSIPVTTQNQTLVHMNFYFLPVTMLSPARTMTFPCESPCTYPSLSAIIHQTHMFDHDTVWKSTNCVLVWVFQTWCLTTTV